ncbi:hypothetical protein OKW30_001877 [Paraburkholderia sp. Clong3]|uniref:hypothetical protein n=1 Tax=Paraburkholderia sp. Clong3 TaxID=2991061 RepID=UPI003D1D0C55
MAFNNVGSFYLAAGATGRYSISFGGADHGAQFIGGDPANPGGCLQTNYQTKTMNTGGTITYWVTIQNIGNVGTNFSLQGGGYAGGYNGVGSFYLPAGATGRYNISYGGSDHGAQAIGGQVENPGGSLQATNQTKCMNANGTITYWATIQNIGNVGTNFALQGGGYTNGFNNVGSAFLAPGASGRYWVSFGGGDHGAQSIAAQVENPGACIQASNQAKCRNTDGTITYFVTFQNISGVATNFAFQGGGFI